MLFTILASAILTFSPESRAGQPARIPIDPLESAPVGQPVATRSKAYAGPAISSVGNVRVNDPSQLPGPAAEITPAIAANGNQVLVVWRVIGPTATQRLRAAWSEDGGNTFTDAGWLPNPPGTWRWGVDPCVEADPIDGTFLIAAQIIDPGLAVTGIGVVTAHIAGGIAWGPVSGTNATGYKGVFFANSLQSTFDATNRTWHLAFDDFYTSTNALIHRYSADHGATWFAPDTVVSDAVGNVGTAPQIGWMTDHGPIVVHHNVPAGAWFDSDVLRSSTYSYPGFPAPVAVSSHRIDVGSLPGTTEGSGNSALAVDRTTHAYTGRAYLAWVESATLSWPGPGANSLNEIEPNETPGTAIPIGSLSGYPNGFLSTNADVDVFSLSLAAGEHVVMTPYLVQSIGISTNIRVEVLAQDGVHALGLTAFFPSDVPVGRTLFTAPRAGTYYLRITGFQVAQYAFTLGRSTQLAAPARDQRDLMTSYSDDQGVSWSSPVPVPMGGPGFDVGNVTMMVANDGRPYLFWQDYSKSNPDGAVATLEVTRSNDGGQTWETARTISSVPSDWNPVTLTAGSNMKMGYRIDAATTPIVLPAGPNAKSEGRLDGAPTPSDMVHVVWPDARDGIASDIYSAHFPTGFAVEFAAGDTTALPGQTIQLRMVLHNKNSLFPEQITPLGLHVGRNWSHSYLSPFSIDESATVVVYPFSVSVPDTAAPGDVSYLGGILSGAEVVGAVSPVIHVQSTTGVNDGSAILAFDPPAPNPVRERAGFQFSVPSPSRVSLEVFDVTGARLRTLVSGPVPAGRSSRSWDLRDDRGRGVAPGVYLARLTVGAWGRTRRLVVTR